MAAETGSNQSVDRALGVLRVFTGGRSELRVSDVAKAADLTLSTASRLLATLEAAGFVDRDPVSGLYQLGLDMVSLGGAVLNAHPGAPRGPPDRAESRRRPRPRRQRRDPPRRSAVVPAQLRGPAGAPFVHARWATQPLARHRSRQGTVAVSGRPKPNHDHGGRPLPNGTFGSLLTLPPLVLFGAIMPHPLIGSLSTSLFKQGLFKQGLFKQSFEQSLRAPKGLGNGVVPWAAIGGKGALVKAAADKQRGDKLLPVPRALRNASDKPAHLVCGRRSSWCRAGDSPVKKSGLDGPEVKGDAFTSTSPRPASTRPRPKRPSSRPRWKG